MRSMEGSGKVVVGVSSHRCVAEDGGMVVLMHSALSLTQARLGKCRGNGGQSTADHACERTRECEGWAAPQRRA